MKKIFLTTLLLCIIHLVMSSQVRNVTIKGKVISDKNEPLPAATVRVKNNDAGVTSDSTGVFMIIVPGYPFHPLPGLHLNFHSR